MVTARRLRVVLLGVVLVLGLAHAAAATTHEAASPRDGAWTIPGGPLPVPTHDESTCVFCQSGAFQHYAPPPAAALLDADTARPTHAVPVDARLPRYAALLPASSRAPPGLQRV